MCRPAVCHSRACVYVCASHSSVDRSFSLVFASRSLDLEVEPPPLPTTATTSSPAGAGAAAATSGIAVRNQWVALFSALHALMAYALRTGRPFNVKHTVHVNTDLQWSMLTAAGSASSKVEDTFVLHDKLGEGAFGAVYKAVLKPGAGGAGAGAGGFACAAKLIAMSGGSGEDEEWRNEMEVLKRCKHPNIVAYYGCAGPDSQST